MAHGKDEQDPGKKALLDEHPEKKQAHPGDAKTPSAQRQDERARETGRGGGEGATGMERGAGHPTGR